MRRFRIVLGLLVCLLVWGCDGGDGSGDAGGAELDPTAGFGGAQRSFLLGLSSQPAEPGEDAYRDAFALAEQAGEVVLVQRTPPWEDFLPGATIGSRTEQLTRLEKELAEKHDLKLFLAVDPTQPGNRGELAGLPEELAGAGFTDEDVRDAFVAYAKYLALNYKPAYMALGVEVDMYYAARGSKAFESFVSLYAEAYDAVKSVSRETLVFPTFQYENMRGILNTGAELIPDWSLLAWFGTKLDVLAVSSYPGLVFETVNELPQDYYLGLGNRASKPVALVSVGWDSAPQTPPQPSPSTEREQDMAPGVEPEVEQVTYLYRVLAAAEALDAGVLIWHLGQDPVGAPEGFEPLAKMGLHDESGRPKNAWRVWTSAVGRGVVGR